MSDGFETSTVHFVSDRIEVAHEIADGELEIHADGGEGVTIVIEEDAKNLRGSLTKFSPDDADRVADALQRAAQRARDGDGGKVELTASSSADK